MFDVFISHASEDKESVARPLATMLRDAGLTVWLDAFELTLGDSLRRKIDQGLADCRYGIVILSPAFFAKEWPNKELDGLVAREDGRRKVILPVWHGVAQEDVLKYSATLADKLAVPTAKGLAAVFAQIMSVVDPSRLPKAPVGGPSEVVVRKSDDSIPAPAANRSTAFTEIGSLFGGLIDRLNDRYEHDLPDQPFVPAGVRTGLQDLDRVTDGLQPGDLIVIASRPSTGNTALALTLAENVAFREGLPVAIFTLQLARQEIVERITGSLARINQYHLRTGALHADEWTRLGDSAEKLRDAPLDVDDSSKLSSAEICRRARSRFRDRGAFGLIVVDSLQFIDCATRQFGSLGVHEALRDLKHLARDLQCPVLLTSAVSRSSEARPDKRPTLGDLDHSEALQQFADVILLMYRDDQYQGPASRELGITEVILAKHRRGPVCSLKVAFSVSYARFEDVSPATGADS